MRIYSSDENVSTPFDEYIGKDVWVSCLEANKYQERYVRFLSKDFDRGGDVFLTCNSVPAYCFDGYNNYSQYDILEYAREVHLIYPDCIELSEPVIEMTSDELYDVWDDTRDNAIKDLSDAVGQNIWIKVYEKWNNRIYYMNILDNNNGVISYKYIDHEYVEDYDYFNYYSNCTEKPSEAILEDFSHIDAWKIYEPVEAMSDDEFKEIIAKNDENFSNGYMDEFGESYD